jgi:hypothetical protein
MTTDICVITFLSISHAMRFEKVMKDNNIKIRLIPVPRSISSSCGLCGRFDCDLKEKVLSLCESHKIKHEKIHKIVQTDKGQ